MNTIIKQVADLQEIIKEQGILTITLNKHTESYIHVNRGEFKRMKKEYSWETTITKPWRNGCVEESIVINGIKVMSLLDESEVEVTYTIKESEAV